MPEKFNIESLKNSLGYNESENKEEFMKGATTAVLWLEEQHERELILYNGVIETERSRYHQLLNDMKTLTAIISKYS